VANLYQKLLLLAILWAKSPHFSSYIGEIWREGADLGLLCHAKYCKNWWRGYTLICQIYTKPLKPMLLYL